MQYSIQYTGELVPVEISPRTPDGLVDLWMRKNPGTDADSEGNIIQIADEAYMTFKTGEAPTKEAVESNFEVWWESASNWEYVPEIPKTVDELSAEVKALTEQNQMLTDCILEMSEIIYA